MSNPVPFNGDYEKQKGPGTTNHSLTLQFIKKVQ